MKLKEAYQSLPLQKRSKVKRKFIDLFGSKTSFYRKISESVPVRKAERLFLEEQLIKNQA